MLASFNWLKEFSECKLDAKTVAEKLTALGLEVTAIRHIKPQTRNICLGLVVVQFLCTRC